MKKILIALLIALPITAYGATYTLSSANYPIVVNGTEIAVEPLNLNGTTYLPLRAISEALDVPIEWNDDTKYVDINTVDIDKLLKSCTMIHAESSRAICQGSAVCWDYGEYLTAKHVIADGRSNITASNGDEMKIDNTSQDYDVASLKTDGKCTPVKIGDSDEIEEGDTVIIISSPQGEENTVQFITVEIAPDKWKEDAGFVLHGTIEGGASGGAVFNTKGELVGTVNSSNNPAKDIYCTSINTIRKQL